MSYKFDTLVDLVNKRTKLGFLTDTIERAVLIESPLIVEEIGKIRGQPREEHFNYLKQYYEQHDLPFFTPFEVTAIEDKNHLVFFEHMKGNEYCVVMYDFDVLSDVHVIAKCEVEVSKPNPKKGMNYSPTIPSVFASQGNEVWKEDLISLQPFVRTITSFIEQNFFLMDPVNFFVKKQSFGSLKETDKLRNTYLRPHYIILNEEELENFVKGQIEPLPSYPEAAPLTPIEEWPDIDQNEKLSQLTDKKTITYRCWQYQLEPKVNLSMVHNRETSQK